MHFFFTVLVLLYSFITLLMIDQDFFERLESAQDSSPVDW